jgi:hypothetical protein
VTLPPRIDVPLGGSTSVVLDVSATLDDVDPSSALTFRWDTDYDGTVDGTAPGMGGGVVLTLERPRVVVVEVENSGGMTSRTRVVLTGMEAPPDAGVLDGATPGTDDDGGKTPGGCPSCPRGGAAWGAAGMVALGVRGQDDQADPGDTVVHGGPAVGLVHARSHAPWARADRKKREGVLHADRSAQFEYTSPGAPRQPGSRGRNS